MEVSQNKRLTSLLILFISGCGFQIIQIQGSLLIWLFIVLILNIRILCKVRLNDLFILCGLMAVFSIFSILKSVENFLFVLVAMAIAYIVSLNYRGNDSLKFRNDISMICQYGMYYTLLHIPILLFLTSYLRPFEGTFSHHFMYLFYFVDSGGPSFTNGYRPSGLAWEPGIWQMIMNLNLYFSLLERRSWKQLTLAFISVVLTLSTSGIFIMIFVLLYYYTFILKRIKAKQLIFMFFLFSLLYGIAYNNVEDKLYGKGATSAMVRFGDTYVGLNLLLDSPWIGENTEITYGQTNLEVIKLREYLWDKAEDIKGDKDGYLSAYIVNGFFIFLLDWGLFIGTYLYYLIFKSNLITPSRVRIGFLLIIFITLFAEPITSTPFFYFFVIYGLINHDKSNKKKLYKYNKVYM